jgi:hypothetical protein
MVGAAGSDQVPNVSISKFAFNANLGTLGIGTATPTSALEIVNGDIFLNSTDRKVFLSSDYDQYITGNASANYMVIATANQERVRVDSSGNVGVGTNNPTNKLEVNGSFAATSKSFLIKHPTKVGMKLQYGSLESPYHGIRLTGSGELVDGLAKIELPDYISALCHANSVNIQITNIKHNKIVWVEDIVIEENYFTARCDMGFFDKKTYKFFWTFTAIRKDIDDLQVEI